MESENNWSFYYEKFELFKCKHYNLVGPNYSETFYTCGVYLTGDYHVSDQASQYEQQANSRNGSVQVLILLINLYVLKL